jgi:hypothetical protein
LNRHVTPQMLAEVAWFILDELKAREEEKNEIKSI